MGLVCRSQGKSALPVWRREQAGAATQPLGFSAGWTWWCCSVLPAAQWKQNGLKCKQMVCFYLGVNIPDQLLRPDFYFFPVLSIGVKRRYFIRQLAQTGLRKVKSNFCSGFANSRQIHLKSEWESDKIKPRVPQAGAQNQSLCCAPRLLRALVLPRCCWLGVLQPAAG